jgi:hypothetical protein
LSYLRMNLIQSNIFYTEEHCMKNSLRISIRITSILLTSVMLFASLFAQPCSFESKLDQRPEKSSSDGCGCCTNTSASSSSEGTGQNNCPCQMSDKQAEEKSPAIFVSYDDNKPEAYLIAGEIELLNADSFIRQTSFYSHPFHLPSRDRPLYILNSTFLI